uniref:Ig-like domain-containing protein n=1 Tax=Paramormyrops kingsleyae TaxID=1676925 RepID=A0A3B3QXS8_9TELE
TTGLVVIYSVFHEVQKHYFFLSGIYCDNKLTQSEPITVKPGESPTISCKVSYSLTRYHTHWMRKPEGKALEWVGIIWNSGGTDFKYSLRNKFTISRDTSSSTIHLKGNRLQTEDTAVYYCARPSHRSPGHNSYALEHWGKGTKIAVTNGKSSSSSAGLISLGCVAGGVSPEDFLSFSWQGSSGNQLSDIYQYSAIKNNGVSMVVSEIRVNAADWGGQTHYECAARHQSSGTKLSERIGKPGNIGVNMSVCSD